MEDYTLSELVKLDITELSEQIELRKDNVLDISETIENFPESISTPERITAWREEMKIIKVLETMKEIRLKYK